MGIVLGLADFGEVKALAIDRDFASRGHDYITWPTTAPTAAAS